MKDLGGGLYQSGTSQFRAPDMQVAQQVEGVLKKITPDSTHIPLSEKIEAARRYIQAEEGFHSNIGIPIPGDDPTVFWGRNLRHHPFSDAEKNTLRLDQGRDPAMESFTEQEAAPMWEPTFQRQGIQRAAEIYGKEFYEALDPARFAVLTSLVFQMDDMKTKFPSHYVNTVGRQWDPAADELLIGDSPDVPSLFMEKTPNRALRSSEILRSGVMPPLVNGVPVR